MLAVLQGRDLQRTAAVVQAVRVVAGWEGSTCGKPTAGMTLWLLAQSRLRWFLQSPRLWLSVQSPVGALLLLLLPRRELAVD